ncbi:unnamed protein product [Moneuplotes crassus]|uniref:Uncharacterized protein n=1 Tax=Euplotes crassus TaxID=5936 RepID=A0AAD1Y446_EUPCR|nr:unnamed protein product [Moneuplotes crassus]
MSIHRHSQDIKSDPDSKEIDIINSVRISKESDKNSNLNTSENKTMLINESQRIHKAANSCSSDNTIIRKYSKEELSSASNHRDNTGRRRIKEFPTLTFDPIFELLPELSPEILEPLKKKLKELTTNFIARIRQYYNTGSKSRLRAYKSSIESSQEDLNLNDPKTVNDETIMLNKEYATKESMDLKKRDVTDFKVTKKISAANFDTLGIPDTSSEESGKNAHFKRPSSKINIYDSQEGDIIDPIYTQDFPQFPQRKAQLQRQGFKTAESFYNPTLKNYIKSSDLSKRAFFTGEELKKNDVYNRLFKDSKIKKIKGDLLGNAIESEFIEFLKYKSLNKLSHTHSQESRRDREESLERMKLKSKKESKLSIIGIQSRVSKPQNCLCQKLIRKYNIGKMNLQSEFEIMEEIEGIINNTKLKSTLNKNEQIKPEDYLQDTAEDLPMNEMKSLYLTEPLIPKTREITRNNNLNYGGLAENAKDIGRKTTQLRPKTKSSETCSARSKSHHSHGYVHVAIRKRDPQNSYEEPRNTTVHINSEYLKQANQRFLRRANRNRKVYKNALKYGTATNIYKGHKQIKNSQHQSLTMSSSKRKHQGEAESLFMISSLASEKMRPITNAMKIREFKGQKDLRKINIDARKVPTKSQERISQQIIDYQKRTDNLDLPGVQLPYSENLVSNQVKEEKPPKSESRILVSKESEIVSEKEPSENNLDRKYSEPLSNM